METATFVYRREIQCFSRADSGLEAQMLSHNLYWRETESHTVYENDIRIETKYPNI